MRRFFVLRMYHIDSYYGFFLLDLPTHSIPVNAKPSSHFITVSQMVSRHSFSKGGMQAGVLDHMFDLHKY